MSENPNDKNMKDQIATNAIAITAHDSNNISHPDNFDRCIGIYFGGAGTAVIVKPDATTVTITAVAGGILPIHAIRVNSTGTTATAMLALY
jgi:hypothetical protein